MKEKGRAPRRPGRARKPPPGKGKDLERRHELTGDGESGGGWKAVHGADPMLVGFG
jgi:hypothetical protein